MTRPPTREVRAPPRGFTLVELVVVIAIASIILGIGLAGRFSDRSAFEARGFASELAQFLGAGQRIAVAQRRTLHVRIDAVAGRVTLCLDDASSCTQPIAHAPKMSPSEPDWLQVPVRLRLAGDTASFSFAPDGAPSLASPATLRLTNASGADLAAGVVVEPDSGHARTF